MPDSGERQGHARLGTGMIAVGVLLVLGMLSFGFESLIDQRRNPNATPNTHLVGEIREVRLLANRQQHYVATGSINGAPVELLIDTGATQIAVSDAVAQRLGLPRGRAVLVSTAAGLAEAYPTRLASVAIGEIELRDVAATIVPGMQAPEVLLGMNFLSRLEMSQRDGQLILRQHPAHP